MKEVLTLILTIGIFSLPAILWYLRNWYYFGNPFFIRYTTLFVGDFLKIPSVLDYGRIPFVIQFFKDIIACFPAFVLSFVYIIKNRRYSEIKFVLFSTFLLFLSIFFSGEVRYSRYMMPIYGIFALYAGIMISELFEGKRNTLKLLNIEIIASLVILFLMIFSFIRIYYYYGQFDPYRDEKKIVEYLAAENYGKSPYVLGTWGPTLIWYGNVTLISPNSYHFLVLNDGERLKYDKNSSYYYELFKKIGIEYIYSRKNESLEYNKMTQKINRDKEHFELVLAKNGLKLWKIK
jgi:hypothetical protein